MIPIRDLFEAHLTVTNLQRSMSFFAVALGLEEHEGAGEADPSWDCTPASPTC